MSFLLVIRASLDLPRWHRRFGPLAAMPGAGFLARKLIGRCCPGLFAGNAQGARGSGILR